MPARFLSLRLRASALLPRRQGHLPSHSRGRSKGPCPEDLGQKARLLPTPQRAHRACPRRWGRVEWAGVFARRSRVDHRPCPHGQEARAGGTWRFTFLSQWLLARRRRNRGPEPGQCRGLPVRQGQFGLTPRRNTAVPKSPGGRRARRGTARRPPSREGIGNYPKRRGRPTTRPRAARPT